ncbi:RDD family protein [Citreicella sp. C3M06]|uniref:RDD family protein n=1 Tax=Roseobacteraceae TaxID=2854170 RepID=UPI001C0A21F1|nr:MULTISPECIES: RDD family protein [Roseobacteraceae]MBU2961535.1 RDD family protein [Citreicella sp. C3M06]MDO6584985.1 RDD family protein [Salipiger sp. 1_MG-2023]
MYADSRRSHLPDPVTQRGFYDSVAIKRGLAWVIDTIIVAALVLVALLFTAFLGAFIFFAIWMVISFGYRVATIANGSATWGMRVMAIEFRDWRGERLDFGQALMHTVGYTVSVSIAPLQLISIVCMIATERGQGLTDLVLGTVALNKRA